MTEPRQDAEETPRARGARAHPNYRDASTLPSELRRTGVPDHVRAWVRRQLGAPVVRARRMPGASSTAVHLLTLEGGRNVVLRRYAWPGFLESEPVAAEREVEVLTFASAHGLPVPDLLAADVTGADIGDAVPAMVMARVPGTAVADPDVHRMAEAAARLHDVEASALGHGYFRWFDGDAWTPENARDTELWQWASSMRARPLPPFRGVLIHRDFHPGNVLWLRGQVSGIVDWANGCRGPAGVDVATCRGELMRIRGRDAADDFAAAYVSITGGEPDPYWEVVSVLEHGPGPWTPEQVARGEHRLREARRSMGA